MGNADATLLADGIFSWKILLYKRLVDQSYRRTGFCIGIVETTSFGRQWRALPKRVRTKTLTPSRRALVYLQTAVPLTPAEIGLFPQKTSRPCTTSTRPETVGCWLDPYGLVGALISPAIFPNVDKFDALFWGCAKFT